MDDIRKRLTDKNDKAAYEFAKRIGAESAESDMYLEMIPVLADMLQDRSSYVRTRAFSLICQQARWAEGGQIDALFSRMRPLLNDPKPTVVRQCLGALHELVLFRPEMSGRVREAVAAIDLSRYRDSMSPLIGKDIAALQNVLNPPDAADPHEEA